MATIARSTVLSEIMRSGFIAGLSPFSRRIVHRVVHKLCDSGHATSLLPPAAKPLDHRSTAPGGTCERHPRASLRSSTPRAASGRKRMLRDEPAGLQEI